MKLSIPAPLKIGGLFVFLCRGCDVRLAQQKGEPLHDKRMPYRYRIN
jgi:hypothetical protein